MEKEMSYIKFSKIEQSCSYCKYFYYVLNRESKVCGNMCWKHGIKLDGADCIDHNCEYWKPNERVTRN